MPNNNNNNNNSEDVLQPVAKAISEVISGERNPSTYTRWYQKGVRGRDGKRIRLEVLFAGRQALTTTAAVRRFMTAVTEARLSRLESTRRRRTDVSDDDLVAVGLMEPPK